MSARSVGFSTEFGLGHIPITSFIRAYPGSARYHVVLARAVQQADLGYLFEFLVQAGGFKLC